MKCWNCQRDLDETRRSKGVCVDCEADDTMVAQASIPNLAALVKRGKAAGLIKRQQDYS